MAGCLGEEVERFGAVSALFVHVDVTCAPSGAWVAILGEAGYDVRPAQRLQSIEHECPCLPYPLVL